MFCCRWEQPDQLAPRVTWQGTLALISPGSAYFLPANRSSRQLPPRLPRICPPMLKRWQCPNCRPCWRRPKSVERSGRARCSSNWCSPKSIARRHALGGFCALLMVAWALFLIQTGILTLQQAARNDKDTSDALNVEVQKALKVRVQVEIRNRSVYLEVYWGKDPLYRQPFDPGFGIVRNSVLEFPPIILGTPQTNPASTGATYYGLLVDPASDQWTDLKLRHPHRGLEATYEGRACDRQYEVECAGRTT
jgi:hypothetical protein